MNFNKETLKFQGLGNKKVIGSFDGGLITSDAGGLLLKEIEKKKSILKNFSECFKDYRKKSKYSVENLISQRVYGIALGYEDLNDHDTLKNDATLNVLVGNNLAGKSTLNRLELTPSVSSSKSRYKKIVADDKKIEKFFVEIFMESFDSEPKEIIIDLDATDDEIHGNQEGKHYHGYYGHYCYLPLFIFCGNFLLSAKLRKSNIDGSFGAKEELERIITQIREKWSNVKILIRGDGGFSRDPLMNWCEDNKYDFIFGFANNKRLSNIIKEEMECAKFAYEHTLEASRCFKFFKYKTIESWEKERNIVAKAEHLEKGANPRFIVTSLECNDDGISLYEVTYCQRGEMENRIKEVKNDLFSGRTSSSSFRANQIRVWFSSVAYLLMNELRRTALKNTEIEFAYLSTIREKVFKIGASVVSFTTKIHFHFSNSYPFHKLFKKICENLII